MKRFITVLLVLCMMLSATSYAEEEKPKSIWDSIGGWVNQAVEDTTNWDSIRNWAAMFAMSGIIANGKFLMTERNVSEIAVSYADKLIEELKKQ